MMRGQVINWRTSLQDATRVFKRLTKKEIAACSGMSRSSLWRYLAEVAPLNDQVEGEIERAVKDLLDQAGKEVASLRRRTDL